MTVSTWLQDAKARLNASGCPDPSVDAQWLAESILNLSRIELRFSANRVLTDAEESTLESALGRRLNGEPVQYILHSAWFMGFEFYVDDRVLIPRQDTETLVEAALDAMKSRRAPKVLDLCAGSGAIGLSVKKLRPDADVTLTDLSAGALSVVARNAERLNASVELLEGDLFEPVGLRTFDFILSNPPYIPTGELNGLQREVQLEPMLALDGGEDGLDLYRRIAKEAASHLQPCGELFMEVGLGEADAVARLLQNSFEDISILNDLNDIPRVVRAKRTEEDRLAGHQL